METREILFHRDEPSEVVEAMAELARRGDGAGWINFRPLLDEDDLAHVPVRTTLGAWFSGRGPAIAMGTWMPPTTGSKAKPAQVGLAHGTGPNALARLDELGLGLPDGWVKRQDHAKHGVVAELPRDVDPAQVLTWLIVAATVLRTVIEPGTQWVAEVHLPNP